MKAQKRIARIFWIAVAASAAAAAAAQTPPHAWVVSRDSVAAHEAFLAGDALRGRGSATPDEQAAAAYVASRFEGYGLVHAPGLPGYLQNATIVHLRPSGPATLAVGGAAFAGLNVLIGSGENVTGKLAIAASADAANLPAGADIVVASAPASSSLAFARAARAKHIRLLVLRESDDTRRLYAQLGGAPRMPSYLDGDKPRGGTVATLPEAAIARLAALAGSEAVFAAPVVRETSTTTNAIGYLPGRDPKAGILLLTAHLDHLGVRPDGVIMHGANDDASGTTAVLELAEAMAAAGPHRRGILFVAYGSEEIGEYGSQYFAAHPPVPLVSIAANLEFEMIGAQDPKLPAGAMMMTGYGRSNLGETLKAHGALVAGDPYPEQNFFERSDNYQLALSGVVAHTLSGWAVTPTYHQPTDTIANLDLPFMTRAIQSLVEPVRWLADGDFQPEWKQGGRPSR
jgi:aminopeptidase YwaD